MTLSFTGAAKRLEDIDLPRIGAEIGVGEDVIHTIIDVEAPKSGFDDQSRPRILFEPHVFWRCLPDNLQARAAASGLAYERWRSGTYGPESAQYGKLARAMAIDETAALKACSWGRAQILAENHLLAGYATPQAMVADFCADEDNHIEAMVRFIKGKKLDVHLHRIDKLSRPSTASDWALVAAGYNGSGYATHNYHGRLADRHNWWRGKPDTPWSPDSPTILTQTMRPSPAPAEPVAPIPPPSDIVLTKLLEAQKRVGFWSSIFAILVDKLKGH